MFFANRPAGTVFAARAAFALAGFAIASWAPLVPYIKEELSLTHLELSRIILLMGTGSIIGMLLISFFISFAGIQNALSLSAAALTGSLLLLAAMPPIHLLAPTVFIFGLTLGCVEVGGNIYGTHLEKTTKRILLPSMHGCYSLGEIIALAIICALIFLKFSIFAAIAIPSVILTGITLKALRSIGSVAIFNSDKKHKEKLFVLPKGAVIFFAFISSLIYMVEGGMLDWSGLFLLQKTDISIGFASSAYIVLIIAMAAGRFSGAYLIGKFKNYKVVLGGVSLCATALIAVYFAQNLIIIYACFMVLGFALANIMPICISLAGKQQSMPVIAAVSSISTCGYGALILGPALIGFMSELITLNGAFGALGLMSLALSFIIIYKRRLFAIA